MATKEKDTKDPTEGKSDAEVMAEAKENAGRSADTPGAIDTLDPEPPKRVDRETDDAGQPIPPEDMLLVNPGFPVGPTFLAPAPRDFDQRIAAQHIGWVRPIAAPEPMPDVTDWKAWEWAATGSARDNFDRVLVRPGQVMDTERDFYDAETCEKEYTLAAGVLAEDYLIPTNYIDRRRRALTLRVYDVTVPESLAFKLPETTGTRQGSPRR